MNIKHKYLHKGSTVLLLTLCFMFVFNAAKQSFHALFEHAVEIHENCTNELELDACHQFVVHHIKNDKCNGSHQHLLQNEEHCANCDFFKDQSVVISAFKEGSLAEVISCTTPNFFNPFSLSSFSHRVFSRGPPKII